MWAALGRLGVAQAVGPARLIAVRPAAAGAFSIPHVTMATHFSKDQEERIRCVKGDLFSCPSTDALAHCISEDCRMGAGIAVLFKKKFGGVQELLDQKKKTGEVAVLQRDERYIYYLITKQKVSHKPTYESMQKSLEAMKAHCLNNGVTDISMPRASQILWAQVTQGLEDTYQVTSWRAPGWHAGRMLLKKAISAWAAACSSSRWRNSQTRAIDHSKKSIPSSHQSQHLHPHPISGAGREAALHKQSCSCETLLCLPGGSPSSKSQQNLEQNPTINPNHFRLCRNAPAEDAACVARPKS